MEKKKCLCKIYGGNALYFLDSLKEAGDKADMVMTDPSSTYDADFNLAWLKACYELLKDGKVLCSFCSPPTIQDFIKQAESIGFKHIQTVWRRNIFVNANEPCMIVSKGEWKGKPVEKLSLYMGNEWLDKTEGFPREAVKPLGLIKDLVKNFTKKGDLVIDFFLGSGTTAFACKELGRNFRGCESNEKFCYIARKRLGFKDLDATGL